MSSRILKVRKIQVMQRWDFIHNVKTGGNGRVTQYDALTKEEILDFNNAILANKVDDIPSGAKVYIERTAAIPRDKFKRQYGNKLVTSPEEADVIISRMSNTIIDENEVTLFWNDPTQLYYVPHLFDTERIGMEEHAFVYSWSADRIIKKSDDINKRLGDKKWLSSFDIKFEGEKMTVENMEKIKGMFDSSDKDMNRLGIRLLATYDYEESKNDLAVLFFITDRLRYSSFNFRRTSEMLFLERKLFAEFPEIKGEEVRFWMRMIREHNTDFVQKHVRLWFNKIGLSLEAGEKLLIVKDV